MEAIQISVIAAGFVVIALSFILSEKLLSKREGLTAEDTSSQSFPAERAKMENTMKEVLANLMEETIETADAKLCKISNEKIISLNEYSEMILERIDKNHSEVVFLYSMLSEKEEELKKMLVEHQIRKKEDVPVTVIKENPTEIPEEKEVVKKPSVSRYPKISEAEAESKNFLSEDEKIEYMDRRRQIIALYENGLSVLEISKELDMGQGEVQLIVNIFTGGSR